MILILPTLNRHSELIEKITEQMLTKSALDKAEERLAGKSELDELRKDFASHARWEERERTRLAADLRAELSTKEEVKELAGKFDAAVQLALDNEKKLGATLGQISKLDGKGRPILSISKLSQESEDFRKELADAVREVMPESDYQHRHFGRMIVSNHMADTMHVRIEGRNHWIAPYRTTSFTVHQGQVATQLVPYEPVKYRYVGAPSYRANMVIRPAFWPWYDSAAPYDGAASYTGADEE